MRVDRDDRGTVPRADAVPVNDGSHGDAVATEQVDETTQVLLAGDSAERRVGVLSAVAGSVTA